MEKRWVSKVVLFMAGQTVTLFGSSLVQHAIGWYITLTTQSGLMMTIATLCGFLPQVLISLFAGVWADRFNRKWIIMLSDGMIAVCTALLAILFGLGYTELWLLFIVSAIRSLGAGIQTPAVSAFLPELVPSEKLMRVNGINASIQSMLMILSPAVAGWLYGWLGLYPVFWVDVGTAVVGISLMALLKIAPREKTVKEPEHFFLDMLSGFRYMAKTRWLRQLIVFYLLYALMLGPSVFLTPLMVARSFGPESWRLMVHEMIFSVGSLLGGLAVGLWGGFRNRVVTLIVASIAFGVTTLLIGLSFSFWFYLSIMLLMGVAMPFINTSAMTLLQTRVEPDLMGRVFGLVSIVGSAAMPLSMVFFGPLADVVSVELQLVVTGAAMVLIALYTLRLKEVRLVGEPLPKVGESAP